MARIRSIKPEFWTDYRMAEDLTRDQRLFYIGLWNDADDEGRFLAHPRRLLGAIFPYDRDLDEAFIEGSFRVLMETGRMVLYEANGEPYGELTKFSAHQRINRPSPSRIPPPPTISVDSLSDHGAFSEPSIPGARTRELGAGSREQGAGAGKGGAAVPAATVTFDEAWRLYPKRSGSNSRPDAERAWSAAVKKGADPTEMLAGLSRYLAYVESDGSIGTQYVQQASRFFGPGEHWREPWDPPPRRNGKHNDADNPPGDDWDPEQEEYI
jgi:hypothetical protein